MRGLLCLLMMSGSAMAGEELNAVAFRLTTAFHCQTFPGGEARYAVEITKATESLRQSGASERDIRSFIEAVEAETPNGDDALSEGLCRALLD